MIGYPEAWVKAAEKKLKGAKVESLERDTPEGIKLKPVYCATDLERCEAVADADRNAPGLFPYHRLVLLCCCFARICCTYSTSSIDRSVLPSSEFEHTVLLCCIIRIIDVARGAQLTAVS